LKSLFCRATAGDWGYDDGYYFGTFSSFEYLSITRIINEIKNITDRLTYLG